MRAGAPNSPVWMITMAFSGVGSTMLGPLLPHLLAQWHLHDHQGGMLVACLFLGSFSGTLSLSRRLDYSLRRGAWITTAGCLVLGLSTFFAQGFVVGLVSLLVMGFGMGQLMSSINLLVGAAPVSIRSRALAHVSAAWCVGAVLSPVLSTVLVHSLSPSMRLTLFAPVFLLPLLAGPLQPRESATPTRALGWRAYVSGGALIFILILLVYGGIEASISAWIPAFAHRYSGSPLSVAQWLLSLFWIGLIAGRVGTAAISTPSRESTILRVAIFGSLACLVCLLVSPTLVPIAGWSLLMGICMGPLFPVFLSIALSYGYPVRVMGGILAACALGSALLPFLLGVLSSLFSLRVGMVLLVLGLFLLLLFAEDSPRQAAVHP